MSRLIVGISGALGLSLISGAAELARGRDLYPHDLYPVAGSRTPVTRGLSFSLAAPREGEFAVNRASKADRTAGPAGSPASTRTVSLKFDGFSDTTFLVRLPVAIADPPAAPSAAKPLLRRPMTACEPVVSILTEVAKRLQPGRCVT